MVSACLGALYTELRHRSSRVDLKTVCLQHCVVNVDLMLHRGVADLNIPMLSVKNDITCSVIGVSYFFKFVFNIVLLQSVYSCVFFNRGKYLYLLTDYYSRIKK